MTIVSIGEVLWDVFDDRETLGGAPFNFAVHATRLGHRVFFVSAVGDDARGAAVLQRAAALGLDTTFIQTVAGAETGSVSVRVDAAGQPDFTIHRPAAYDALSLTNVELDRLSALQPDWLYYGTLYQSRPAGRIQVQRLVERLPAARRFYDVNLRRDSYTSWMVANLLAESHAVKLNDEEAVVLAGPQPLADFTAEMLARFGWQAVAVTRGANGCVVRIGADYVESPGYAVQVVDTVGAGDAFAAAFLHGLAQGWDARRTGDFANRLGAEIAGRPGAF